MDYSCVFIYMFVVIIIGDEILSLSEASKSNVETYTNGSLIINAVKNDNAGSYECEITNSVGVGLRKKIRISVSGMPKYVLLHIFYELY